MPFSEVIKYVKKLLNYLLTASYKMPRIEYKITLLLTENQLRLNCSDEEKGSAKVPIY